MTLSNKVYDKLKFVALIVLPALATFYAAFGQLWEFPATDKVVTTIVLVGTLLGALLQLSTKHYNEDPDGFMEQTGVDPDTGIPNLRMTLVKPTDDFMDNKFVQLKTRPPQEY